MTHPWGKAKIAGSVGFIGLLLWMMACIAGGPKPATPPLIPVELPVALRYPDSVAIPVQSAVAPDDSQAALAVGDNVLPLIFRSVDTVRELDDFVAATLVPLNQLGDIPVSIPISHFRGPSIFTTARVSSGPATVPISVSIDFSDFDFDGDGVKEGCSGCTCPVGCGATCPAEANPADIKPVCYRVWVEDISRDMEPQRLISGVFSILPTPENRGAGLFKGVPAEQAVFGPDATTWYGIDSVETFQASYDQFDVENRFTDYSKRTSGVALAANLNHSRIHQAGTEGAAVKTIQFDIRDIGNQEAGLPGGGEEDAIQKLTGRWREGADLWSGSFDTAGFSPVTGPGGGFFEPSIPPGTCAELQTGTVIDIDPSDGSECRDDPQVVVDFPNTPNFDFPFGIDVSEVPFIDPLPEDALSFESVFPDFPEGPAF